jgi:hypothetical protein
VQGAAREQSLRETLASSWRVLAGYLVAGVVYVAIGVAWPDFLFSWVVAAGYLVLCIVLIPRLYRRIRA